MDQDQNKDNDLFNFDSTPPPRPSQDEPTVFAGSARAYETPQDQQQVSQTPPPPPYMPPPPYGQPPAAQPPKRNRTLLIVVIVLAFLCCCCLLFLVFMYQWGADWLIEEMGIEIQYFVPSLSRLLA
jgi:hypothetical protein